MIRQLVAIGSESTTKRVQVNFNFTNPNHIPPGIPRKERGGNQEVDRHHIAQAFQHGYGHLAKEGRLREGRVDTGEHILDNEQTVQLATLRRGFANIGLLLEDSYSFYKEAVPNKSSAKEVVRLVFSRNPDNSIPLSGETLEAMRSLAKTTWQWCHVWKNPDGSVTINLGGRLPDVQRPKSSLVVRDRSLQIMKVTEDITEEQE